MPTFYCYQRCSTCKKAERWLVDHGVAFDKVDLVATPPAEALPAIGTEGSIRYDDIATSRPTAGQ